MAHVDGDVNAYLKSVLTELRAEYARRLKAARERWPGFVLPCETCAFRTSTDTWGGFDSTIIAVIAALEANEPFYCHHDMERAEGGTGNWIPPTKQDADGKLVIDFERMRLCSGYAALSMLPELDLAGMIPESLRKCFVEIAARQSLERAQAAGLVP